MVVFGLGSIPRRQAVVATSAAVYRTEAAAMEFRARTVRDWLESFGVLVDPTSGELAEAVREFAPVLTMDPTQRRLWIRRGLSELKAAGKAHHETPRVCTVTKRECVTWRLTDDGSRLATVRDSGAALDRVASVPHAESLADVGPVEERPATMSYASFLDRKKHHAAMSGFAPTVRPSWLFDFQADLVDWATRKGRAAIFADCGLGKTPIQLVWAQNVIEHTNRPVLILTPLAVASQTAREADKFGIPCERSTAGETSGQARIVIANYERLHLFRPEDYSGVVCDESSILKNFEGATKASITEFMRQMSYRLLCTATAAPNDHIELGTSSEAIGDLGYMDMLTMFFKNDEASISPLSYSTKWRFKPHAERPFWQWLCSWARAVRRPSDLGFDDGPFKLPPLTERVHIVESGQPLAGRLFAMPAKNLQEQRAERRATLTQRCETVAALAHTGESFVAWCHLNDEADALEKMIAGAVQVSGADSDDEKVEKFDAFASGQARALITKPRIGGFGLNWQHCRHMSFFPSHSYEQYYQGVRRCWRYGQTRDVLVDVVSTEGEADVLGNLKRKADAAETMFAEMVAAMGSEMSATATRADASLDISLPSWMDTCKR